jgi:hypothetical protein
MDGKHMTKDEALDLALEALENSKEVFTAIQEMGIRAGRSAKEMRVGEVLIQDSAITAIKQARALDKMAAVVEPHKNARELRLDYEPAEVLGHNGWGFPIKAAAPVQEDWGPGPHEYHSLTAAPVVPDVMTTIEGEHPEYVQGWNDCRQLMLQTRNNRHD